MANDDKPRTIAIDGYPIDVAISEEHKFETEVTEYPVESGSDITDHVRKKPNEVTLEGIVSDTPLAATILERLASGDRVLTGLLSEATASLDALAKLMEIRDARKPVTISTSLKTFESMVLTTLTVPRANGDGRALRFHATFKEIRIITNERSTTKVKTATPGGGGKGNQGSKMTSPPGFDKAYAGAQSKPVFTVNTSIATYDPVNKRTVYTNADRAELQKKFGEPQYTTTPLGQHNVPSATRLHWNADINKPGQPKADGMITMNPDRTFKHSIGSQPRNPDGSVGPAPANLQYVTGSTTVGYSHGNDYFYQSYADGAGRTFGTGVAHFDQQQGAWMDSRTNKPIAQMNRQGKPATPADVATGNIWGRGPSSPTVDGTPVGRPGPWKPGGF